MLDAKALAKIKNAHAKERHNLAERQAQERRDLSAKMAKERKADVATFKKSISSTARIKSAEQDVGDRVKAHAALKATHDKEYKDLNKKHAKQLKDAEDGKAVTQLYGTEDVGGGALLSRQAKKEHDDIKTHFTNAHNRQHNADEAAASRHARYKSSSMQAAMEKARLEKHSEIDEKEQRAMASLRRKVEAKHRVA